LICFTRRPSRSKQLSLAIEGRKRLPFNPRANRSNLGALETVVPASARLSPTLLQLAVFTRLEMTLQYPPRSHPLLPSTPLKRLLVWLSLESLAAFPVLAIWTSYTKPSTRAIPVSPSQLPTSNVVPFPATSRY
jgi:hypothetical protein